MVEIPTPHYLKPGHRFDSGPIILDLYRLLSLVLAEKQVSALIKAEFDGFAWLRERYLESEIVRILISAATSIRISFDQTDPLMFENLTTNCGTLHWPKQDKTEVLDLREACNKIIHATRINFDGRLDPMDHPSNPEPDPLYLYPFIHLHGQQHDRDWYAKLSITDFVRWAIAAFRFGGYGA